MRAVASDGSAGTTRSRRNGAGPEIGLTGCGGSTARLAGATVAG